MLLSRKEEAGVVQRREKFHRSHTERNEKMEDVRQKWEMCVGKVADKLGEKSICSFLPSHIGVALRRRRWEGATSLVGVVPSFLIAANPNQIGR